MYFSNSLLGNRTIRSFNVCQSYQWFQLAQTQRPSSYVCFTCCWTPMSQWRQDSAAGELFRPWSNWLGFGYSPIKSSFWSLEESTYPRTIIVIDIVRCIELVQYLNTWGIVWEVGIGSEVHYSVTGNILPELADHTSEWVTCGDKKKNR